MPPDAPDTRAATTTHSPSATGSSRAGARETLVSIDAVEGGVAVFDPRGRYLAANRRYLALFGLDADTIDPAGLTVAELMSREGIAVCGRDGEPVDAATWPTIALATGADPGDGDTTSSLLGFDLPGSARRRWLQITARRQGAGDAGTIVATCIDVSDEVASEDEVRTLRDMRASLAAIVEHGSAYVVISGSGDERVRFVSDSVVSDLGWTLEQLRAAAPFEHVHPDDVGELESAIAVLLGSGERPVPIAYRIRTARGDWRHLEGTLTDYRGRAPIDGVVSVLRDVTAQRVAQHETDLVTARLEAVLETVDDVISETVVGPDGLPELVWISPNYWRITGLDPGDWSQVHAWPETIVADDRPAFDAFLEDVRDRGQGSVEVRTQAGPGADVRTVWTRSSARAVDGEVRVVGVSTDVTDLRRGENERAAVDELVGAALANLRAGVVVEDSARRVAWVNPQFVEVADRLGVAFSVGAAAPPLLEAVAALGDDPRDDIRLVREFVERDEAVTGASVHLASGRSYELDFMPIRVDDEVRWRMWVTRDITHRVRASAALEAAHLAAERARAAAEASSASKTRFLATMSHEIRTPLNGVIGMLELLGDARPGDVSNDERADMLDVVRGSADAMLAIISEVLELARRESGEAELEPVEVDVRSIVEGVRRLFAPRAAEAGVALSGNVDAAVPPRVVLDAGRLRQVLVNLVDNALRHAATLDRAGTIELVARPAAPGAGGDALELQVRDTGPGIPPDVRAGLFDPFVPGGAGPSGTGLGLSICQRLVGMMGGEIECRSEVGVGTTFRFTVPFATAGAVPHTLEAASDGGAQVRSPTARRVLVVEDNAVNREILARQLARLGHDATIVDDGAAALARLTADAPFDCVLMDCQMAGMDGYVATRRLRDLEAGDPARERVPVIAVTAASFDADRERCIDAGMDDVLDKPVRLAALRGMLDRYLA